MCRGGPGARYTPAHGGRLPRHAHILARADTGRAERSGVPSACAEALLARDAPASAPRPVCGERVQPPTEAVRAVVRVAELPRPAPLLMRLAAKKHALDCVRVTRETVWEAREARPAGVPAVSPLREAQAERGGLERERPLAVGRVAVGPRGMGAARPSLPEAP